MKKMKKIIPLLFLALSLLLTACGAPAPAPAAAGDAAPLPEAAAPPLPAATPPPAASAPDSIFADEAPSDYFLFPTLTPSEAGDRRLVYTVAMRLQTMDFQPGMRALLDAVADAGGYLISADVRGYDLRNPRAERAADFRFRVPSEQLPGFIVVVENNFNIWSLQQDMTELTVQYQHTEWSLEDLREEERRLLEVLETARGEEYTAASEHLRSVRWMIRDLEASQAQLMDAVIYSTVEVQLFEAILPLDDEGGSRFNPAIVVIPILALAVLVLLFALLARRRPSEN